MSVKLKNGTLETCFMFLLSPFLSIPFILIQLKLGRDKYMALLISILVGLLSFSYVPTFSDDKVRYIERYNEFKFFNYLDLWSYFKRVGRPDFIFDHFIFFFSKVSISFNYLFFIITFFTVLLIFNFIRKIAISEFHGQFNFSISIVLLILFSFSIPDLLSGIRFNLALSIFIWAIYYIFNSDNKMKGLLLMLLTILLHFSFSFFIIPLVLVYFWPKKISLRLVLAFSLVFVFLPKEFLLNIFGFLSLPENYLNKASLYLENEVEFSDNAIILRYISQLWLLFVVYYFVFVNKERRSKLYYMVVISIAVVNITYAVPLVFNRYLILLKLLTTTFFIILYINKRIKPIYFYIFFLLSLLSFFIGFYVVKVNFEASYSLQNLITLVTIFSNKMSEIDIL